MSFLSIKTFKKIYKKLNYYVEVTYGKNNCPISEEKYKPIIGNSMEEIDDKYPNKGADEKITMAFYICKKIADKNFSKPVEKKTFKHVDHTINKVHKPKIHTHQPKRFTAKLPINSQKNQDQLAKQLATPIIRKPTPLPKPNLSSLPMPQTIIPKNDNSPQNKLLERMTQQSYRPVEEEIRVRQEKKKNIHVPMNDIFTLKPGEIKKSYAKREEFIIPNKFRDFFRKQSQLIQQTPLVIDSRDRNTDAYPNPNSYIIDLNEKIHNILTVELQMAIIPNGEYTINDSNNKLYFQETSGVTLTATITDGNYTIDELVTEIQTQLIAVGGSTYTVTNTNNYIRINSDLTGGAGIFSLIFESVDNSIGQTIGFDNTNLTGSSNYTAENKVLLDNETDVFLHIQGLDNIHTVSDEHFDNFAKLDIQSEKGEYTYLKTSDINQKYFPNQLKNIDRVVIDFYKNNGERYNFNGLEHSLLINFVHYTYQKMPEEKPEYNQMK